MSHDAPRAARLGLGLAAGLIALASAGLSCGQIEPEPPRDERGEVIPQPPPFEPWLRITRVEPEEAAGALAQRPTLVLTLSDYLDERTILTYDVASLESGGVRSFGVARYILTRKQLIWRPSTDLVPGLEYTLRVAMPQARSHNGSPLWPERPSPRYLASQAADPWRFELDDRPRSFSQDIEPILQARCARCHRDPQWGLDPLTYQSLVGGRSAQLDRVLVRPGSASTSYLMHKLLPDFTDRRYTAQPPPWDAQSEPLDEATIWTFERWIEGGAQP